MSAISRKEWYSRVNAAWAFAPGVPAPQLTGEEAVRAVAKLWRFVLGQSCPYDIVETSGRRYTGHAYRNGGGVVYANPSGGWSDLVHELSHDLFSTLYRGAGLKPHAKEHARLELRMIREVHRRGWLEGALRKPERPANPKPSAAQVREERLLRILGRIVTWERKLKRAENALAKLRRQARYYQRAASAAASRTVH